jgi:MSHA biogenesis protein MshL
MSMKNALLAVFVIAVLSGCGTRGGLSTNERDAALSEALDDRAGAPEENAAPPPLPAAATAMLEPPPLEARMATPATEPRFDINADAVPVANFYYGLVADTPYNVVVHPDVEGTISLRLSDVSVPEVMEILREGYGYHYRRTQGSYMVLPSVLETRVFRLHYINVQREGLSGTSIAGGEIESSEESDNTGDDQVSGSNLTTRSSSRLWTDVEAAIEEIISGQTSSDNGASGNTASGDDTGAASATDNLAALASGEPQDAASATADTGDRARVVTSPEAGAIVVRATPDALEQVETFIDGLQATVNRQVILEARIVEVTLDDQFEAGIDWDVLSRDNRSEDGASNAFAAGDTQTDVSLTPPTDIGGLFELGILRNGSFDVTIDALDQQGDVMVLSSPRVSTLNNQKALIKVGTDTFFQTGVDLDTTTTDGTAQTTVDPEFRSFFSGISLDVTPSIDADGSVTMHVQPSVTSVSDVPRTVQTAAGETVTFDLASSDVRQSDSIVRAEDGDLIIIGGLMEQRDESRDASVPVLGDLPPLSLLFSRQRQVSRKVELVILLRPTVIGDDTWQRALERQREAML